jgi:hypothetical protein
MKKKTIEEAVIGLAQLIKDDHDFFIQKPKEQTAVEWLIEQRQKYGSIIGIDLEQAKEMEKQQIIDAHLTGLIHPLEIEATKQAEQYYNETFNK